LVEAACLAPAPHHSFPWRWVIVDSPESKHALARAMGERWRADLARDGIPADRIDRLVDASDRRLTGAPALVLGCLTDVDLDTYPDESRRRAEHGLALCSLGAAIENLSLAATDAGLGSCWVAAPMFCPDTARDALALPDDWLPHALVLVGWPDPSYRPPTRSAPTMDEVCVYR
jgi:F420 biosynthesis protein FbiB-like protein